MVCKRCGVENSDTNLVCFQCELPFFNSSNESDIRICGRCGTENDVKNGVCQKCGDSLYSGFYAAEKNYAEDIKICKRCSAENYQTNRNCDKCGTSFYTGFYRHEAQDGKDKEEIKKGTVYGVVAMLIGLFLLQFSAVLIGCMFHEDSAVLSLAPISSLFSALTIWMGKSAKQIHIQNGEKINSFAAVGVVTGIISLTASIITFVISIILMLQ